ncbi:hypothetical protein [Streptomyces sp. SID12501]|nr:hypothetical protein [Streptomyces sp. SID12501]
MTVRKPSFYAQPYSVRATLPTVTDAEMPYPLASSPPVGTSQGE